LRRMIAAGVLADAVLGISRNRRDHREAGLEATAPGSGGRRSSRACRRARALLRRRGIIPRDTDCPLEGTGFEISVPGGNEPADCPLTLEIWDVVAR
jgi:hypothetical protein